MAQQTLQTFNKAIAITTSDTVNSPQFDNRYPDAYWVGTAGILACVFGDSSVVAFTAPQGLFPIKCVRINNTNTTADLIVGLWQG